ncbi:hypothetical protein R1flu_028483 [Riccia fluitans]|uniref:Uncharacterized protein n=1 Tax=Riccia fluitans TaxID=41844 RepID=A0ABD1XMC5_9MARC
MRNCSTSSSCETFHGVTFAYFCPTCLPDPVRRERDENRDRVTVNAAERDVQLYQIRRKLCLEEQGLRLKRQAFAVLNVTEYVDRASRTMKARKFRRRADEVEEDAEESDRETKGSSSSGRSASKKEKSKPRPGSKSGNGSLLSFGGEDEEKVGNGVSAQKIRKKSSGLGLGHGSSQRFGIGRDKSAAGLSLPSNMQAQVGEYTKEKLAELHRNTVRLGAPNPPPGDNKPTEPVVVLNGLLKPPGAAENANVTDSSEENFFGDALHSNERIDSGAESGGITHIPDAAAIAAAKAMRERARQAQSAPDYISLAPGDGVGLRSRLCDSGLVREHDDAVEGEEEGSSVDAGEIQGRLAFMGEKITDPKNRTGVFEATEEMASEEMRTRKMRSGAGPSQAQVPAYITAVQPVVPSGGVRGFGRPLEGLSIAQQAEAAMRSLQESVQRLRETHSRTQNDLHMAQENLASTVQNHKAPVIEEHMQRLHEERSNAVTERRAGDNADELAEVEVAVGAAKAVLTKGRGTASATAAAVAAAAAHAAKEGSNIAPQLDEFGRDVNLQKRLESKQRAQRRATRAAKKRAAAFVSNNGDASQRVEGESRCDESESEMSAYQSRREEVLETAKSVSEMRQKSSRS